MKDGIIRVNAEDVNEGLTELVEQVMQGHQILFFEHGIPIAEMIQLTDTERDEILKLPVKTFC
jgi:antitoxin (DNA-binding transcriptional repressor) of toxin-antitoxin stability system